MKLFWLPSFLTLLIISLSLQSCEGDELVTNRLLVVEGHIDAGDYPVVCVTTTLDPSLPGTVVSDCIVRWAKVTLSDGERTVVLAGGPDRNFFPPYTYRSYDMKGRPGATYTLTVEYNGQSVTAVTTIPTEHTEIENITLTDAGADTKTAMVTLHHRHPATGYYRLFARVKDRNTSPLPTMLGTFAASPAEGRIEHPANRPKTDTDTADYTATFSRGEIVEIRLAAMERQAYDFWIDYDNAVAFGGSQFLSPTAALRSNIHGGLGYFFGYNISRRQLTIE